jgi:hypothetical protein
MTPTTLWRNLLATVVAALIATPCLAGNLNIKDAPKWVNTGTTYETMQGTRYFHGVGLAPTMGDRSLQQSIAESHARNELKKILSVYLDDLTNQYKTMASTPEDKAAEQLTNLGKPALQKAKVIARWRDRRTGSLYTLIQLNLDELRKIASESSDVSPAVREYIKEYGDIVFDSESQYVEY